MDLNILDTLYRRNDIIDDYNSLIWTERFSVFGDFQLVVNSTLKNRSRFQEGTLLGLSESKRVMTVETVQDKTAADGTKVLEITGPSLEEILDDRAALSATDAPTWDLTGTPGDIARQIFHDICVTGILDPGDIIAGITEGSLYPADTIAEPSESITVNLKPASAYESIKLICDAYSLGFRLVKNEAGQLYFDVYAGSDRTSGQTTLPAVIFSPNLDNLQNTNELKTISGAKNVAYVISSFGHEIVYPLDVDPTITGFDRRVLLVDATNDIPSDTDPLDAPAMMIQKGNEALAANRAFAGFDGEINETSQFKYERDYYLGDIIELRNIDGVTNQMQVTEQIFVSDNTGKRSYPTLSLNKFITPGSWSAWDYNQVWEDLDPSDETWADQP